ncbi:MAG: WG repeat-containing protein [Aristaeellaceae bacterium]
MKLRPKMMLAVLLAVLMLGTICHAEQSSMIQDANDRTTWIDIGDADYVYPFVNGFARFFVGTLHSNGNPDNGLYGFIDRHGNVTVPPTYVYAEDFDANGYAKVYMTNASCQLIDRQGHQVLPQDRSYEDIGTYSEGLIGVYEWWEGISYLDIDGHNVLQWKDEVGKCAYTPCSSMDFVNGYAVLQITVDEEIESRHMSAMCEYGIVDKQGTYAVQPGIYDHIDRTEDDYYIVAIDKKKGILDKNLNVILEPAYDSLYVNEHDGHWYATLCDGQLMGLYDLDNKKQIVPAISDDFVDILDHTYCTCQVGDMWHIINMHTGTDVSLSCESLEQIRDNYFIVTVRTDDQRQYGVYDVARQTYIIDPVWNGCYSQSVNGIWCLSLYNDYRNGPRDEYVLFSDANQWEKVSMVDVITMPNGEKGAFIKQENSTALYFRNDSIALPNDVQAVASFSNDTFIVRTADQQCGLVDQTGRRITDAQWDMLASLNADTAFVASNNQVWYIDSRGQRLNSEAFSFPLEDFAGLLQNAKRLPDWHDLLPVVQNGRIGMVWRGGDIAIAPGYDMLLDWFDDVFLMGKGSDVCMVSPDDEERKLNGSTPGNVQLVNKELYMVSDSDAAQCVLMNRDHKVILQTETMNIIWRKAISSYQMIVCDGFADGTGYICCGDQLYKVQRSPMYLYDLLEELPNNPMTILTWLHNGEKYAMIMPSDAS